MQPATGTSWLPGCYISHIRDLLERLSCGEVGHLYLLPGFALPSFIEHSQHCILARELAILKPAEFSEKRGQDDDWYC